MNKYIIIYLPSGNQAQYSTIDLNDKCVTPVQFIEEVRSSVPEVVITDEDGDQIIYKGMPYSLDIWDKNKPVGGGA